MDEHIKTLEWLLKGWLEDGVDGFQIDAIKEAIKLMKAFESCEGFPEQERGCTDCNIKNEKNCRICDVNITTKLRNQTIKECKLAHLKLLAWHSEQLPTVEEIEKVVYDTYSIVTTPPEERLPINVNRLVKAIHTMRKDKLNPPKEGE